MTTSKIISCSRSAILPTRTAFRRFGIKTKCILIKETALLSCRYSKSFFDKLAIDYFGIVEAQSWGAGEWINPLNGIPILDIFSDGSADGIIYIINQLMAAKQQIRLQPILSKNYPAFNANPQLLLEMQQEIEKSFLTNKQEDEKLNKLVKVLLSR